METLKISENKKEFDLMLKHLISEDEKVFKDYLAIRKTFSREIDLKEKKRSSLPENIHQLGSNRDECTKKKSILDKNISIYEKNLAEIEKRLTKLIERENWIKKNYSDLVHGTVSNPRKLIDFDKPGSLSDIFYNLFKHNIKLQEHLAKSELKDLQKQKEGFLETLKKLFGKYDDELITLNDEKLKLNKLNEGILNKLRNATHSKNELKANIKKIREQIIENEKNLVTTIKEEKIIIAEFQKIVQNIKADLNVSDITMEVLTSCDELYEKNKTE